MAPSARYVNKSWSVAVDNTAMPSLTKTCLLLLCTALSILGASTQIASDKPVINFSLPNFTPEGNRAWLVRGSEARFGRDGRIDIQGLNLSIFTGQVDGKVETLILSPSAQVLPSAKLMRGSESIRVINDAFEATGTDWSYSHEERRISISKNVHVVLHTQLKPILQ